MLGAGLLDTLIRSKTRLNLLLRFFLNPKSSSYLRELSQEFGESTNSVRIELNRFENAGLIKSSKNGNKKIYTANTEFPLYKELRSIAFKHLGIDQILNQIIEKLGDVKSVYLTGDLARGIDTSIVDISIIGEVDTQYLVRLVNKVEKLIGKKIRTIVYSSKENYSIEKPKLLIYGSENGEI